MTVAAVPESEPATDPQFESLFDRDAFINGDEIEEFEQLVKVRGGVQTDLHLENGVKVQAGDTITITTHAEVISAETGKANKSGTIARETVFVKPIISKAKYMGQNGPAKPAE